MSLLMFTAPWCQSCKAIKSQVPDFVEIHDVEQDPDLTFKYQIKGVPTFVITDNQGEAVFEAQTTDIRNVLHNYEGFKNAG